MSCVSSSSGCEESYRLLPGMGASNWGSTALVSTVDFVIEISLGLKCDVLNFTAVCCGPTISLKQIWIFLSHKVKGETVPGMLCQQCPWPSELRYVYVVFMDSPHEY